MHPILLCPAHLFLRSLSTPFGNHILQLPFVFVALDTLGIAAAIVRSFYTALPFGKKAVLPNPPSLLYTLAL